MILNINSNAVVSYTNTLEKLHKSAFPVAIRETLNSAAFDVKKNTMPLSAKKSFIERQPTFFKANSKVDKATGFNTSTMKSTVGFFSNNLKLPIRISLSSTVALSPYPAISSISCKSIL